jgi:hypothetical protein
MTCVFARIHADLWRLCSAEEKMKKTVTVGVVFAMVATSAIGFAATQKTAKKKVLVASTRVQTARGTSVNPRQAVRRTTLAKKPTTIVQRPAAGVSRAAPMALTASPGSRGGSAGTAAVMPATGVTSLPVTQAKVPAKKNPVSFKYRSYNAMDMAALAGEQDADFELRAWDRFKITYAFSPDISLALEPQLYHTWFGDRSRRQTGADNLDQPYSANLGDTNLILVHSKLARLQGDINVGGLLRYNIPTSEASQKNGQLGEAYLGFMLGRSFGALSIEAVLMGRHYMQQYNTSLLTKGGVPLQNKEFRLYTYVDFNYEITKKLSLFLETGFMNTTWHSDSATGRPQKRSDQIIMNPEVTYAFNDNFALSVGFYEEPDMRTLSTDTYVPLAIDNGSEGYFMTTIKF